MRAMTIRQPCAYLIVVGFKPVENRTKPWPSTLELPCRIGIHAGKGDHPGCWDAIRASLSAPSVDVVYGALIGFATVVGFHHADECGGEYGWVCSLCGQEDAYDEAGHPLTGDVDSDWCPGPMVSALCDPSAMHGMWHYELEDPELLAEPIPMRGALGLWRLPQEVAA